MRGNKGEWSEVYVLLRLLSDGTLNFGDALRRKSQGSAFPIIEIQRESKNRTLVYTLDSEKIYLYAESVASREDCLLEANKLFKDIVLLKGTDALPDSEVFLRSIGCDVLKANSKSKADIRIVIHDFRTGATPLLGFSIKSHLGNSPTLLNASQATNFIYAIDGELQEEDVLAINLISPKVGKIQERIKAIEAFGAKLTFIEVGNTTFRNNLNLIDSSLATILSKMLMYYYRGEGGSLVALCEKLEKDNPLDFDQSMGHLYYRYKLKKFLVEVALGMLPTSRWHGIYDATGGYIVVKEDGDVLCYHFYNRNDFEDYLLHNTRLDTPSSSRNHFGYIETDPNGVKRSMSLNLQLRFS